MQTIEREEIATAYERIRDRIRTTPLMTLEAGAFGIPGKLLLKLELFQHTGSFKPRGAFNRMLTAAVPPGGVIAASGGNFGLGVAYAAQALGHPAEIFVPDSTPLTKRARLHRLGADVRVVPGYYADALAASQARAEETGALGGGGLIGGIASWFAGRVRVIGVEPERAPTLHAALRAGRPVDVDVSGIAADALGARRAGTPGLTAAQRYVERVVLVADAAIREAQVRLWEDVRVLAEPGGAAALAALLARAYTPGPAETVCVLVCGGNADPQTLTGATSCG